MPRNTCRRCARFTPDPKQLGFGDCVFIEDTNDVDMRHTDRAYSWDYEGYSSGAYVGEHFGCIHFTKRVATSD
jgi:hypothetical protein